MAEFNICCKMSAALSFCSSAEEVFTLLDRTVQLVTDLTKDDSSSQSGLLAIS